MNCEICGAFEDNLFKTNVEGAFMNLCKSCSKDGKVIAVSVNTSKPIQKTKENERQLKYNYLDTIKNALHDKALSVDEVANKIKFSTKDMKKILNGEVLPDGNVTAKLERLLNISLYEIDYTSDLSFKKDTNHLSFEDVVDIKRIKK